MVSYRLSHERQAALHIRVNIYQTQRLPRADFDRIVYLFGGID